MKYRSPQISATQLKQLIDQYGDCFYLVYYDRIKKNYLDFFNSMQHHYAHSHVAFSVKANYSPAIIRLLDKLGAYTEVSSEMEYDIAIISGVKPEKIIVNGPAHSEKFIERVLLSKSLINLDSWYMIRILKQVANENLKRKFQVGIRLNYDFKGSQFSRFGFEVNQKNATQIKNAFDSMKNVELISLHAHYSTPHRSLDSFVSRTGQLIRSMLKHFYTFPIRIYNIGGGFFSNMPVELQKQFKNKIPSIKQYAETVSKELIKQFGADRESSEFFIEPGTAMVADAMDFVCKVIDTKNISRKNLATVNASYQNIKPTRHAKTPVAHVLFRNNKSVDRFDVCGYTCMEDDYLIKDFKADLRAGDYLLFENCGAYTINFKPPFIQTAPPIIGWRNNKSEIIKRLEKVDDLLRTYQ